jgi:predicted ribosome quality control (RQC) complex YloA/Tae2 family protein
VSNAIRYDSLLVRALASELNEVLSGARLTDAFLERDVQRVTLRTRSAQRGQPAPPSLLWQLHPTSGHLTEAGAVAAAGGRLQLAVSATILSVTAPADERVLAIELDASDAPAGTARRIVIELITNQWNAVAVGLDDRIVAVLRERRTRDRELRAGIAYAPPPRSVRPGAHGPVSASEWIEALRAVPPAERRQALLGFAYTSPVNAGSILGDAEVDPSEAALLRALDRYTRIAAGAESGAYLVFSGGRWQPYPVRVGTSAEATATLLDAFAAAANRSAALPEAAAAADTALDAVARRLEALGRREERLRGELDGAAADARQLRQTADLLLAQLPHVPRGAASIELDDFAGGVLHADLDPALSAADNANRFYDAARRRDRAAARIPPLLEKTVAERSRLEALAGRIRDGTAQPGEIASAGGLRTGSARAERRGATDREAALPYRAYRTSGGIEVRVGRGSKANDDLTFRFSSPSDVWLHARDVAGAHVILRWPHGSANPPAPDIAEAAVLAALHSRARTSGLVAVDWTRRKYVRKARKAGPGQVIPERVRTVFVEPDPALEVRLRVDPLVQD